ncbi:hypothetical protein GOODEAATRI_013245, partial [Goodea atripinnis]
SCGFELNVNTASCPQWSKELSVLTAGQIRRAKPSAGKDRHKARLLSPCPGIVTHTRLYTPAPLLIHLLLRGHRSGPVKISRGRGCSFSFPAEAIQSHVTPHWLPNTKSASISMSGEAVKVSL